MKKQIRSLAMGAIFLGGSIAFANQRVAVSRSQFGLVTLSYSQEQIDNLFLKNILKLDPKGEFIIVDLHRLQAFSDSNHTFEAVSLVQSLQDLLSDQSAARYIELNDMRLSSQDRSGSSGG